MYFNHAPSRTRHQAQCQNDAASSTLTSVFDGRVKRREQRRRGPPGFMLPRDFIYIYKFSLLSKRVQVIQQPNSLSPQSRPKKEPSSAEGNKGRDTGHPRRH